MSVKRVIGLLILSIIAADCACDATIDLYTQVCTNSTLSGFNITAVQRTDFRTKGQQFGLDLGVILALAGSNGSYGPILKGGGIIIVSIILLFVCIVTLIVTLSFCCCCDHVDGASERTAKVCMGITLLFLIVTVVFFILTMVYLGKFKSSLDSAICFVGKIPYNAVHGYSTVDMTFIGLTPLRTIFNSMSTEITSIQSMGSNFDQIVALNLPASTAKAYSDLETFYNKYSGSTTSDGQGVQSKPGSITTLTKEVNQAVGIELAIFKVAGETLDGAAKAGKGFTSGNSTAEIQSALAQAATMIQNFTTIFVNFSTDAAPAINSTSKYIPVGLYVSVAFGCVLMVLCILAGLVVSLSLFQHKNVVRCGVKLCLFLVSLMVLILSIVAVVMYVASFVLGTTCSAIPTIVSQTNLTTWLASYNISGLDITGQTGDLLNTCMAQGGSGDMASLFLGNATNYLSAQNFLVNITQYQQLKSNMSASGPNSLTIVQTSAIWALLRDCLMFDQQNAATSLIGLNNAVLCGNQQMVFDSVNCTSGGPSTCVPIKTTASWTPPACTTNPVSAQTSFTNLKAYCNDENTLLSNMIKDLNDTAVSTTPGAQVTKYKADFTSAFPLFDQVVQALTNTLTKVQSVTTNFGKSLNCTVVRQELLDLEAVMCFSTSPNLANFSNWLALFVLFTILTIYGLCCTLRCTFVPDNDIAYEVVDAQPPDNAMYSGKDQTLEI